MTKSHLIVTRLLESKVPIQAFWPDFMRGVIQVQLLRPASGDMQAATQAFKGMPAQFSTTTTPVAPLQPVRAPKGVKVPNGVQVHLGSNTANDTSPWAGGDFIIDPNAGELCTDGWPVSVGGQSYMTTAGHCSLGDPWFNGTFDNDGNFIGDGDFIGTGSQNALSGSAIDSQLLATGVVPDVWTGNYPLNRTAAILGWHNPPVGESVCQGGAFEGTICGAKVSSSSYNACISIQNSDPQASVTCHVYEAVNPPGVVLVGQGDSGGPAYTAIFSGQVLSDVSGIGSNTAELGENLSCPAFPWRGNVCSDTMLFTGLGAILNQYNGNLITQ